jgi:hypothetical protein
MDAFVKQQVKGGKEQVENNRQIVLTPLLYLFDLVITRFEQTF